MFIAGDCDPQICITQAAFFILMLTVLAADVTETVEASALNHETATWHPRFIKWYKAFSLILPG